MLKSFSLDRHYSERLSQLFGTLPMIGEIIQRGQIGLKQFFEFCRVFKYLPKEEIIRCGEYNPWIFYVLSGECLVIDETDQNDALETIGVGEMFGEIDVVMDTTGQNTVLANPTSQEVVLLGFDSSAFMVQSSMRLADDLTRIACYQALIRSMLARHKLLVCILRDQRDARDLKELESLSFGEQSDSKHQLILFDIEAKKLALELSGLHSRVLELAKNRVPGLPDYKAYLADSHLNKQAVFTFAYALPYELSSTANKPSVSEDVQIESTEVKSEEKSVFQMQDLSFLVVDDDDHHRESTVAILKKLGARQIHIENNGQVAWEFICEHSDNIDIILCDWIMPEMSGLDLYHRLHESGDLLTKIIFIMLTSIESKTSVLEAVENGIHGYVIKPVNQKHILKQVQQALRHVRGAVLKT